MLDMIFEKCMLRCRAVGTPMKTNVKLLPDQEEILDDPGRYQRLMGKLKYLMISRPDIAFFVSV